jgi:hypothetical protein
MAGVRLGLGLGLSLVALLGGTFVVSAQGLQPGAPLPEGAHIVVPSAPEDFEVRGAPQFYQEFLVTSPGIRPSYVPGFIPKVSPRFLNPRQRPPRNTAMSYMQAERKLQDLPGGHFGSNSGWQQTGVTANSPTGDYHTGRAGVTRVLQFGFPEGQRVIEPVLVPMPARSERGGWFIDAGTVERFDMGESTNFPEKRGQRATQPQRSVTNPAGLPTHSSQLANPTEACAPTGRADGDWGSSWRWVREPQTGVQRLSGRSQ